jgi:hypothetical protein
MIRTKLRPSKARVVAPKVEVVVEVPPPPKEPDGLEKVATAIKDTSADQVQVLKSCAEALAKPDDTIAQAIRSTNEEHAEAMKCMAQAVMSNKPEVKVNVPAPATRSWKFSIQRDSRGLSTYVIATPI